MLTRRACAVHNITMTIRLLKEGEIVNEGDFYYEGDNIKMGATVIRDDAASLCVFNKPYNPTLIVSIFRIEPGVGGHISDTRKLAKKVLEQKRELEFYKLAVKERESTIDVLSETLGWERKKKMVRSTGNASYEITYQMEAPICKLAHR